MARGKWRWRAELAALWVFVATCSGDGCCSDEPIECTSEDDGDGCLSDDMDNGCGSYGDDDDDDCAYSYSCEIDAAVDAARPADAPQVAQRRGRISIAQVRITNDLTMFGLEPREGASIAITYEDPGTATVAPAFGPAEPGFGQCSVFVYDVGMNGPPDELGEGLVSIEGSVHGPLGCRFGAGGYRCVAAEGSLPAGTTVTPSAQGMLLDTPAPLDFSPLWPQGMHVSLAGFASPANNGLFAIVDFAPNQLTIVNPAAEAETVAAGDPVAFALLPGHGPIPQQDPRYSYFDTGAAEILIGKEPGTVTPGFTTTVPVSGAGLTLASASPQPHEFPSMAGIADWTLSCGGLDGDCGTTASAFVVLELRGVVSDGDPETGCDGPCLPFEMPAPIDQWGTFLCRSDIGASEVTLAAEGIAAVHAMRPTWIETRLVRATLDVDADPSGSTDIAVGYGLVGYSDVSP